MRPSIGRRMAAARVARVAFAVPAVAGLLAACGSAPPTHFHSLLPAAADSRSTPLPPQPAWELLPVVVPAQVDQPQWVLRLGDDSLAVLENERWIAPLGDEIRAALVERIGAALSAGTPVALPAGGRAWRLGVEVRRFDSAPARYARLEVEWSLRARDGSANLLRCRGVYEQAVSGGFPALAAGHRTALAQLGDALATALEAAAAGTPLSCPIAG